MPGITASSWMPALLTRIWIGAGASSRSSACRAAAASVTSKCDGLGRAAAGADLRGDRLGARAAGHARGHRHGGPSAASARQIAAPIAPLPPVTSARLMRAVCLKHDGGAAAQHLAPSQAISEAIGRAWPSPMSRSASMTRSPRCRSRRALAADDVAQAGEEAAARAVADSPATQPTMNAPSPARRIRCRRPRRACLGRRSGLSGSRWRARYGSAIDVASQRATASSRHIVPACGIRPAISSPTR